MPYTVHVPRRFDASYSLLGRWMRRSLKDERQAEALFILAVAAVAVGLVLLHYLLWVLVRPEPRTDDMLYLWAAQAALWLLCLAICGVGFRPPITVTATPEGLVVEQGRRRISLRRGDIRETSIISALLFHRHYRRYAATQAFVNRIEPEVLLLHTRQGHVVLGLPSEERAVLLRHLAGKPAHEPYAAA